MTRGKAFLIDNIYIHHHDEFNGDMYRDGLGQNFYNILKTVKNPKDFSAKMRRWNKNHHNYSDFELHKELLHELEPFIKIIDGIVNVRFERDYYDFWFSDYVYLKNISSKPILIVLRTNRAGIAGEQHILKPGETAVSNFGKTFEKWETNKE